MSKFSTDLAIAPGTLVAGAGAVAATAADGRGERHRTDVFQAQELLNGRGGRGDLAGMTVVAGLVTAKAGNAAAAG